MKFIMYLLAISEKYLFCRAKAVCNRGNVKCLKFAGL